MPIGSGIETGGRKPPLRQWLHDLEHEAAALALWKERAKFGRLSPAERAEIHEWSRDFAKRLRANDPR